LCCLTVSTKQSCCQDRRVQDQDQDWRVQDQDRKAQDEDQDWRVQDQDRRVQDQDRTNLHTILQTDTVKVPETVVTC